MWLKKFWRDVAAGVVTALILALLVRASDAWPRMVEKSGLQTTILSLSVTLAMIVLCLAILPSLSGNTGGVESLGGHTIS